MSDAYWTEARRADSRALPFEPYRGHRIIEFNGFGVGLRYAVEEHPTEWWRAAIEARAAVDRCVDAGECDAGRKERDAPDPFDRFGGPLYG